MEQVEDGKKIVQMWMPSHLNLTYNLNLRHLRIDEKYRTLRDQEIVEALDESDTARLLFEHVEPEAEPALFLTYPSNSESYLLPSTVMGNKALSAGNKGMQTFTDTGDGENEIGEDLGVDDDDDDSRLHSENEYAQDDDYEVYLGPNNEDWCYDPDSDDYFNALKVLKIETSQKQSHSVAEVLGLVKQLKHDIKALLGCRDMPESYYRMLVGDLIPFFDDGMHYPINNRLSHIT